VKTVAYLVNQYPAVSHTFIRREIRALEALGRPVERFAIRPPEAVADDADREELDRTFHVLSRPPLELIAFATLALLRGAGWRGLAAALRGRGFGRVGPLRRLAYWVEACRLHAALRRRGIEHLHAHFGTNPACVARLIRIMGGPTYSFTVHGPDELDDPRGHGLDVKIRDAAFVSAITSYTSAQLRRWARPEDWGKIRIVRCVVDAPFFEDAAPVDPASGTLLCVGRLAPQKGHLVLLDAFAAAAGAHPNARLVLAGDGPLRDEIERRARALGLGVGRGERVEITGWISGGEVRRLLRASRALVLPSFAEGLPMVIMEALAARRPVVSTYVAGIPELVRDGETGLLVPSGDAAALADALTRVLSSDAADLDALAARGRDAVKARHDPQTEASRLNELFAAALGEPGAHASSLFAPSSPSSVQVRADVPADADAPRVRPGGARRGDARAGRVPRDRGAPRQTAP